MSARARRPTDDERTERFDPDRLDRPGARPGAPAPAAAPLPASPVGGRVGVFESFEQDVTEVTPLPGSPEVAYATAIPADPGVPAERRRLERSEPIRVISMKDHTEAAKPRSDDPRVQLQVHLRSMAEVAGRNDTPVKLGHLAPPRDPRQVRARHVRANVVWACVAVVLAGAISLAIWLVAGR
jgi:hypothetical protein